MKILSLTMLFVAFVLAVYAVFVIRRNINTAICKIDEDIKYFKKLKTRIYVDNESSLPDVGTSEQTAYTIDTGKLYFWDYSSELWTQKYASIIDKPLANSKAADQTLKAMGDAGVVADTPSDTQLEDQADDVLDTSKLNSKEGDEGDEPAAKPLKAISYEKLFYLIKNAFLHRNSEALKALLDESYYKSIISIILTNEPSLAYVQLNYFSEVSDGDNICILYKYTTTDNNWEQMEFWYFNKDTHLLTDIKPWI